MSTSAESGWELRAARLDTVDALVLVEEVQSWYVEIYGGRDEDPLDPDAFVPPGGGFVIAYAGAVPAGMGGWSRRGSNPRTASIRRMYVRPAHRRSGLAAAILSWLDADARAAGVHRFVLTTGRPQRAAVAFYRAQGFTDIPAYGFYADSGTAVHLGRELRDRAGPA